MTTPFPPQPICTGILDLSSYEPHPDLVRAAKDAGIVALIAKATEGSAGNPDRTFLDHVSHGASAGLLLGGYHFARGGSGKTQADFFLHHFTKPVTVAAILPVLDWENNAMPLAEAEAFCTRIHEQLGVWPMVYGGQSFLLSHLPQPSAVLGKGGLWIAKYGDGEPKVPSTWPGWDLWQYTDGKDGPRDLLRFPRVTPGVGAVDRSVRRGTAEDLRAWWLARAWRPGATPP